jgi:transposase
MSTKLLTSAFTLSKLFGRKTEKKLYGIENGQQVLMSNEAEEYNPPKEEEMIIEQEEAAEIINVPAHSRKKPGRRPLPEDLPRVDVIHDISEEEKVCACGCMKERIGNKGSLQM